MRIGYVVEFAIGHLELGSVQYGEQPVQAVDAVGPGCGRQRGVDCLRALSRGKEGDQLGENFLLGYPM